MAFLTFVKKESNRWNLKISANGTISVGKYIELRNKYITQREMLASIITEESVIAKKTIELQDELSKLTHELSAKDIQLSKQDVFLEKIEKIASSSFLEGEWEYYSSGALNHQIKQRILIKSNDFFIVDQDGNTRKAATIANFCFNHKTKKIFFLLVRDDVKDEFVFFNYNIAMDELGGKNSHGEEVVWKRISFGF